MHDCRRTQDKLSDLLFNALTANQKSHLLAEVKDCEACQTHYKSLTETLSLFDEAVDAALPKSESYWLAYDERLYDSLNDSRALQLQSSPGTTRISFWRRAIRMRVQVPVPALAAAALILIAIFASLLILRPARTGNASPATAQTISPPFAGSISSLSEVPARIVEVPVVREKIVTRIVYVNKKQLKETRRNDQFAPVEPSEQLLTARAKPLSPARFSLAGFQPIDDVKITVVKPAEEHK